ncbi:MAG: hypothetical protein IPJ13_10785 [Saprospiraceae bacterium]|nr:hypothetical protein [Saprospiraceae bacterium]
MNLERYQLETDDNSEIFEFISLGSKGKILKRIKYIQTEDPKLWNLSMGDVNKETDEVDYFSKTNNGDTEKVLATVVATVFGFFKKHPNAVVYATGSTESRTRLYQMGINKYYSEIKPDYHLLGNQKQIRTF